MAESTSKSYDTELKMVIIGLLGVIVYLLIRDRDKSVMTDMTKQISRLKYMLNNMDQRLDSIVPMIQPNNQPIIPIDSDVQHVQQQQQQQPQQQNMSIYNNKEKWKVVRDSKGDIIDIEVDRNANIR